MNLPERSYLFVRKDYADIQNNKIYGSAANCYVGQHFNLYVGDRLNCEVRAIDDRMIFFIGDLYDSDDPELDNAKIADRLCSGKNSFTDIIDATYCISGKWIIAEDSALGLQVFGDPTCTKSITYHKTKPVISDMASIVASLTEELSVDMLKDSEPDYYVFTVNSYKKTNWWCGNATGFLNVYALLPNRIYCYDETVSISVYIPTRALPYNNDSMNIEYCYNRSVQILNGFMKSVSSRGKDIQLSLTGGGDSRMLWAASMSAGINNSIFVSMHGSKTSEDADIVIARKLAEYFNTPLNVLLKKSIDVSTVEHIKEYFPFVDAESFAELDFSRHYIKKDRNNLLFISGLIPEVMSRYYYNRLCHVTAKGLCDIARCACDVFAERMYDDWLREIRNTKLPKGYKILDLFYWEHRAGRWASQTSNIADLYQENLFGINCREFFDIWIQVKLKRKNMNPERENIKEITRRFSERYLDIEYERPSNFMSKVVYFIESHGIGLPFRQTEYMLRRIKIILKRLQ